MIAVHPLQQQPRLRRNVAASISFRQATQRPCVLDRFFREGSSPVGKLSDSRSTYSGVEGVGARLNVGGQARTRPCLGGGQGLGRGCSRLRGRISPSGRLLLRSE